MKAVTALVFTVLIIFIMVRLSQNRSSGSHQTSEHVIELTDANFNTIVQAEGVILVDFWAPWCGPCRAQGPIIDHIADDFVEKAKVGKLNVDHNRKTAQHFNIRSIPTLIVFKDGKEHKKFIGGTPKEELTDAINAAL